MNQFPDDHKQIGGSISGNNIMGEFDFPKFWKLIRKSGVVILLLIIFGLGAAWFFLRYTVPLYESSSVLKLDIKSDSGILGLKTGNQQGSGSNNLSGEIELIKSDLIHNLVIDSLPELNISYYSKGKIKDEERFRTSPFRVEVFNAKSPPFDVPIHIKIIDKNTFELELEQSGESIENSFRFGELIQGENADFRVSIKAFNKEEFNSEGYYFVLNSRNSLLRYLRTNLLVATLNPNANTIRISFRDPNRFKAKEIVNTINAVYMSETLTLKNKASSQTIDFLNDQLERTDSLLSNSEKEIENFIRAHQTTNILGEVDQISIQIEELNKQIEKTRLELKWIDQFESEIKNIDSLDEYLEIGYFPSENMARSANEIVRLHQEFKKLKYSSKSTTLAYRAKKEQYDNAVFQLNVVIRDEKNRLLESMDILGKTSRSLEEELASLPERSTEYNRLKRYYDLNEKFYLLLMNKKAEYGISESGTVPEFQVLSSASLPARWVSPNTLNSYLAGIGGALVFSLFFVFIRFLTHNTFESIEELESLVKTPILGAIPGKKKLNSGHSQLVVHQNPKSAISEAFRTIRTNLDFISPNEDHSLISVSSTISGEGKTFVAINLGAIIAMSNKKVVVLDLDMRKPKIHLAFEGENEKGMSNILIGRDTYSDCLKPTELENLFYIPSGPVPPNPSELIMLESFDQLLEDLSKEFDLVIMDSPPVGLVTDGVLLMKKAHIPLYVVRAHFTTKGFNRVIENLTKNKKINNLSIVFNGQSNGSGSNYGYGYGYGGGYYEEKESKKGILGFFGF